MSPDRPESKYKLYQFVCSAIFCEYITQRRGCKSAVNVKPIQADLSHLSMQAGETFSEVLRGEHHKKRCQEWSTQYCDSWLTCRKIHKQAGPGCAVNRRHLLPEVGTQSFESHFSALSIHSLLAELNYIRSNLVSHLFSSAGQETYLHEVAIAVKWAETGEQGKRDIWALLPICILLYNLIKWKKIIGVFNLYSSGRPCFFNLPANYMT